MSAREKQQRVGGSINLEKTIVTSKEDVIVVVPQTVR